MFGAMASVIDVAHDPQINSLLTQYGMPETNRNIWSWTAEFPDRWPSNSPMTGASIDTTVQQFVAGVDQALSYLGAIPNSWTGSVVIGTNELPIDCAVQVDAGDVAMFQAGLSFLKGLTCIVRAYEFDINAWRYDVYDSATHGDFFDYLLPNSPALGTVGTDAPFLGTASNAFRNAIAFYQTGSALIRGETDYQVDDMVIFDPDGLADEQEFRDRLADLDASFDATTAMAVEGISIDVNAGAAFSAPFVSATLRPEFDAGEHPVPGTWPDLTFGGVLPDNTEAFMTGLTADWPWPNNATLSLERQPVFFWEQMDGATWYQLVVNKDGAAFRDMWVQGGPTWETPIPGLGGGVYTWRTRAYGPTQGLSAWSPWATFTVAHNAPTVAAQIGPQGLLPDPNPTFMWNTGDHATYYQVYATRNRQEYFSAFVAGNSTTTYQHSAALQYGDYKWWLQSWNPDGSAWSGSMDFMYGKVQPIGPQGLITDRTPTLSWDALAGATWYNVRLVRDGVPYDDRWVNVTSWTPGADLPHGTYSWWVCAWGPGMGIGPWSDQTTFTIERNPPAAIDLHSPTGGVAVTSASVDYQWGSDNHATWYQLWSGQNGIGFHQKWYSAATVVSGVTATVSVADHMWGEYQWYVRGWGPDGLGNWSQPGGQFVFGQPAFLVGAADVLTWDEPSAGANWYQVWINDVTGGGRVKERAWWFPVGDTTPVTGGRSVDLTPNLTTGDYEWTIRAWSSAFGQGPWSDTQAFNVP